MISKLSAHLGPTSLFSGGSAPSLVLHLDAGNTFSYIGTGSTWYDLTSLNNDISLSNTSYNTTYGQLTKFEGSFEFNGTSSFGSLISGTAIPLMNSHYTIESWIQADSIGSLDIISGQTKYYIRLLDANNSNTIMFTGFFYVDNNTNIVQTFYDSINPTVDIRSTAGNGGPTYLYYSGWLCFDGGGCNITSFPYLYGASTGDYNLYGNVNSSTGNNVDGYSNVTYEFSFETKRRWI